MPNTGLMVTLPDRLIWLVRLCFLGWTVVTTVPRASRPGVSGFALSDVQPVSMTTAALVAASARLFTDSPLLIPGSARRGYRDHANRPGVWTDSDRADRESGDRLIELV